LLSGATIYLRQNLPDIFDPTIIMLLKSFINTLYRLPVQLQTQSENPDDPAGSLHTARNHSFYFPESYAIYD